MSTGAMFWRQEQSFVDGSHVVAVKTIPEVVRVDKGKMLSTEAMSTGAMFCRQEPCCGDSNPGGCPGARLTWPQGGVLSTGAMSTGAFLEAVPTTGKAWGSCLDGLRACLDGLGPV